MSHSLLFDYKKPQKPKKRALALARGQPVSPSQVGVSFSLYLVPPQPPAGWRHFSQVNLSFWSVGGGGGGRELGGGHAQGHLLQGAVLTGVVTTVGIGTARGGEA